MKKIIDGRGTGKTSRLLLLAKENDGIIVCENPQALRERAYRYGITGLDIIDINEYHSLDVTVTNPIYIDNLSWFLATNDPNIAGYSENKEE